MSADNLPDGIPLNDVELLQRKYSLDDKAVEAVKYIMENVPLTNLKTMIGEDYFLRRLIPIIEMGSDMSKLRALEMLGKYLGVFMTKRKVEKKKVILD